MDMHDVRAAAVLFVVMAIMCSMASVAFAQPAEPALRLAPIDKAGATFRLYEGLTLLVNNPEGKAFNLTLDVRDLNLVEPGPREILFKVYDPEGKPVVREVIPDDGVTTPASQLPTGGWDHEGWFYIFQYNRGSAPMLRWSALAAPDRLAVTPVRTFDRKIAGGVKGTYRVMLVGARDHVVTVKTDPVLSYAVGGNPFFLHPVGDFFKKRFIYVPRGAQSLYLSLVEHDMPRTRRVTLRDETGAALAEVAAPAGIGFLDLKPAKPGDWDDKVLSLELTDGPGACMVQCSLMFPPHPSMVRRGPQMIPAFYAPDADTAKALQNAAIYHDGKTFWRPVQVRFHEYLKTLKPEDYDVKGADGSSVKPVMVQNGGDQASAKALDLQPNRNKEFLPLNGAHEPAPLCDAVMFSYDLHRNRQALNVAIRDLAGGLELLGPNDFPVSHHWRGMANLAYTFGTYNFHWWRPAWRIIQEKDAPDAARELVRETITNAADRLAFCRNWERVNGNAFATVLCGLRYAAEGTQDKMNIALCDTFHDRFTTGGFGQRVGLGPSGLVQEEFAYDNHYGSYPIATIGSVARDIKDPRFIKIHEGLQNFYSYSVNGEVSASPFSARTAQNPAIAPKKDGPYAWKGNPGPDFTESINNANEFFAARRKNYYILSYHGRMTPKWECEAFRGQIGWSGGVLCQLVVPGKGTVLASTVDQPGYGTNMHPSQWRTFRINSIVGVTADGLPMIGSDCEHPDAKLEGNTVAGSGEVRNSSVRASRSYTYNADHVVVEARLAMTYDDTWLNFWFKSPFRGHVAEAWEMIPFLPRQLAKPTEATAVKVLDASGKEVGELGEQLSEGQTVVIDRGGFGVRVELEKPMKVKRGAGDTVMIQLIAESPVGPRDDNTKPNVNNAEIRYKLVPFGN